MNKFSLNEKKVITGDPNGDGCAPNAGAFDVACEKLPPNADAAVVAFEV